MLPKMKLAVQPGETKMVQSWVHNTWSMSWPALSTIVAQDEISDFEIHNFEISDSEIF